MACVSTMTITGLGGEVHCALAFPSYGHGPTPSPKMLPTNSDSRYSVPMTLEAATPSPLAQTLIDLAHVIEETRRRGTARSAGTRSLPWPFASSPTHPTWLC